MGGTFHHCIIAFPFKQIVCTPPLLCVPFTFWGNWIVYLADF